MTAFRFALLALLFVAPGVSLSAQTIRGRVLDAATGEAVPNASVTALASNGRSAGRTRTDSEGGFVLYPRVSGTYLLRGERTGYQAARSEPFEIGDRETVEVELRLSVEPLQIEPLTVTARRSPPRIPALEANGVYRREARGFGRFLWREDIERQPNMNAAQILDRVPGTRLLIDKRGRQYILFERARCLPKLYLNGSMITYEAGNSGMDINDAIRPEQIEAIELYRGPAEVPVEFGSDAACGVIVIWTRTGP